MSQSASQAAAFYRDVARTGMLWTIVDEGGYPTPTNQSGQRAMPFWSSLSRVRRIIKTVPAYSLFSPVTLSLTEFLDEWVADLTKDKCHVGVNWSGKYAIGYDCSARDVVANVSYYRERGTVIPFPVPKG
jgi:hypothetical protein